MKRAIEIDSSFALAYCTLAECYIALNKFNRDYEDKAKNRIESKNAINNALTKAIELNVSLAEAYISKGLVMGKFDWDWNGMKKMAEKGLSINPYNYKGYILLSNYYLVRGNIKKALENARYAEKLDPLNAETLCLVAERLCLDKQYEASINKYNEVLELYPYYGFAWNGLGYVQYISGKKKEAVNSWQKLQVLMGNNITAEFYLSHTPEESVAFWLETASKGGDLVCANPSVIGYAYLLANDIEKSLEYLTKAYYQQNEDLPFILQMPHFSALHKNNQFTELVGKVGVKLLH